MINKLISKLMAEEIIAALRVKEVIVLEIDRWGDDLQYSSIVDFLAEYIKVINFELRYIRRNGINDLEYRLKYQPLVNDQTKEFYKFLNRNKYVLNIYSSTEKEYSKMAKLFKEFDIYTHDFDFSKEEIKQAILINNYLLKIYSDIEDEMTVNELNSPRFKQYIDIKYLTDN